MVVAITSVVASISNNTLVNIPQVIEKRERLEPLTVSLEDIKKVTNEVKVKDAPQVSSDSDIEIIVRQAARKYGINEDHFVKIANCESTLTPSKVNYGYWEDQFQVALGSGGVKHHPSGLFQHLSNYWPERAAKHGYAGASVLDAVANANVTAAMFSEGHSGLWECK